MKYVRFLRGKGKTLADFKGFDQIFKILGVLEKFGKSGRPVQHFTFKITQREKMDFILQTKASK